MFFILIEFLGEFVIFIGAGWLDSSGQISHLEQVYGTSTDDCKIACRIKIGCVGFTYVSTSNRCDLKDIQQAVTLQEGIPATIISGSIKFQCMYSIPLHFFCFLLCNDIFKFSSSIVF